MTDYVEKAIRKLGHTPVIHLISEKDIVKTIQDSPITHWVFTGTSLAVSVLNPLSPQVPMEILEMKEKRFFLICYSMESLFYQMGYPVVERKSAKKERIDLEGITVYRHHKFYIPTNKVTKKIKVLQTYDGEVMTACYKNTVLTQWHPERTPDGILCLQNWITDI